ncbi:hypothetical protein OA93_02990 [Flavobacterium sp. KMS]|nr:hypothetical protein OA93_02990 [Flavobacterium sp. KMS]
MLKQINLKIILILFSILILIVPDIIINRGEGLLTFGLTIFSKCCFYLFLYLIILNLLKSYFWTYFILGFFYLLSSCIEVINVIILGNYTTVDNIKALFYTSSSEMEEFINGFYVYILLPIILVVVYVFILLKFRGFKYKRIPYCNFIAIFCLLISFALSYLKVYNSSAYYSGKNLMNITLRQHFLKEHPLSLYYRVYEFGIIMNKFGKYNKEKKAFSFGVINKKEVGKPELVVLVIGERIRYSNWGINGYKRSTSTNLDNLSNLISFDRHYSNGNSTVASIPLLITQATPQKPEIAYSEKTIVSLFKEAGYETVWISNQNIFDYINNKDEADKLFELYRKKSTDLDIIPVFNEVLNKKESKKRLIVINMIGGHGKIPENFNLYKPNNSKENYPVTIENAPIFINNYDNMIRLQDFVLGKIINLVQKENKSSVFMFTADHGCNLFDDSQALFGYGSQNPTEKETHIPLFIWGSSKYIEENAEKFDNLKKHKKYLTTNNDLFYTLADLASIKYTDFKKNQSIADSTYSVYKERYVYVNGNAMKFNSK